MKAAFYKSTLPGVYGWYNRLVRWWSKGKYSHCEIVFSDGLSASSSFSDHGVRFKHIEYNPDHWDFIDLPVELESQARQWFIDHQCDEYDLLGNVGFVFDFVQDSKSRWFCSEAFAASLGLYEPWRYDPNGLYQIIKFLYGRTSDVR